MGTTYFRNLAFIGWSAVVLVLSISLLGCGGGQMNAPTPVSQNGIAACTDGTVASYLGTSCSQLPSVMHWTSYSCTSTPTTICDSLGPNGANVRMRMDPDG